MKFDFLGRVISVAADGCWKILTSRRFARTEDYSDSPFHPPAQIPATLIVESMAASGGHLVGAASGGKVLGLMVRVEEASFFAPVQAGDEVVVRSELLGMQDGTGGSIGLAKTSCRASIGDKPVAEARIVFLCIPAEGFKQETVKSEK